MSTTTVPEVTDEVIAELLDTADSNTGETHAVCPTCHPPLPGMRARPGTVTLCGRRIRAGVEGGPPNAQITCPPCAREMIRHIRRCVPPNRDARSGT